MKKLKYLIFSILLCTPLTAAAQDIEINAENFPDENFRSWLFEQDYGKDGILTEEEIKGVTTIQVLEKNIRSLKGIEYFTALTLLDCSKNQLTTLDVSQNIALTELWCYGNQLMTLDVSHNITLTYLTCFSNQLTTLDVSKNTALTTLSCTNNQLTTLDVSQNTALTTLSCAGNHLTTLDVSQNTALTHLICYANQLTTLDISQNTALTELYCDNNQLTTLDVSQNTALTLLDCYQNQIKGESMDALISSLPQNTSTNVYKLYVYDSIMLGEGNVCTQKQVAAAKDKGWTSYYRYGEWEWIEYEGCDDAAGIALPELETENGNALVYNLSGQKVTSPVKGGIYIIGGKKVVVK